MLAEAMCNSNFLDTLLTEDDFSFIKSLENDINQIHLKINLQNKKRDAIVNLINTLNTEIGKSSSNNNSKKGRKNKNKHKNSNKDFNYKKALLAKANNIFQLVNSNIKSLYSLETSLKNLNDQIVELLVSIDADDLDESNKDKYITIIQNLKSSIDEFSNKLEDTNSQIEEKDKTINAFFKENEKMLNNYICIEFFDNKSSNDSISESVTNYSNEEKSITDNLKEISSNITELTNSSNKNSLYSTPQEIVNSKENSTITNENIEFTKDASIISNDSQNSVSEKTKILDYENKVSEETDEYSDNLILIVSEKEQKVYLPYKVSEINAYLEQFADKYESFEDVVEKEFIVSLDYYMKHPVLARFREAYSLIRDRESKSISEALKYAIDLMFKYNLNPTIVAACKTQEELENYLNCLDHQKLEDFNNFKIEFRINPLVV